MTFYPFVSFENGFITLVPIKSISLFWKILPSWVGWNEGYAENFHGDARFLAKTI